MLLAVSCGCMHVTGAKNSRGRSVSFAAAECFCFCVHDMKTDKSVIYLRHENTASKDRERPAHYSTSVYSNTYIQVPISRIHKALAPCI
jgi:hypothetical protein